MDYYNRKIYIPKVDKRDRVLGAIERWEAHKKGLLHRAFTIALYVGDKLLLQHRRHPVFDGVIDLTCSSHPIMSSGKVQDGIEAVYSTLAREWGLLPDDVSKPVHKGVGYYSASDKNSVYKEHEVCRLYTVKTKLMPNLNSDFSYGFSLMSLEQLKSGRAPITNALAPWVPKLIPLL